MGAQPNVNPDQLQELSAAIDQVTGVEPPQPAANPIKLKVGGKEIVYDDPAKLAADIEGLLANQQRLIQQSQQPAQQTAKPTGGQVTGDEPEPFSKDKFADLLVNNPVAAADYQLRYSETGKKMRDLERLVGAQNQKLAIYEFMDQNKDFPAQDPQAWQALDTVLKSSGLAINSQNLGMAFAFAKQRGFIQQPAPPPQQEMPAGVLQQDFNPYSSQPIQQPANVRQMPQRPVGLPGVPRTNQGADEADIIKRAEGMTAEQLKQLLTSGRFGG